MNTLHSSCQQKESGFTLIELMVSMLIALVILAGLYTSFSTQNTEYSYQNKRIDAVQDLEFAMKYIAEDLRSSLIGAGTDPTETNAFANNLAPTTDLWFWVWDAASAAADGVPDSRAQRRYHFDAGKQMLCYDRQISAGNDSTLTVGGDCQQDAEILLNVTFFKVFKNGTTALLVNTGAANSGFMDPPVDLQPLPITDGGGAPVNSPGYTILVEIAVQAGYNKGSFLDVLGNDQSLGVGDGRKRVWRYMQVHPQTAVNLKCIAGVKDENQCTFRADT